MPMVLFYMLSFDPYYATCIYTNTWINVIFKVKQEMVVPLELLQSSGLTLLDNDEYDDEEIKGEWWRSQVL